MNLCKVKRKYVQLRENFINNFSEHMLQELLYIFLKNNRGENLFNKNYGETKILGIFFQSFLFAR